MVISWYFFLDLKVSIMANLQSGKYNVAWFKLAEFVMRKEKERALAIYRLLAHSICDKGLVFQLEGDLLWSFADQKAIDSYIKAGAIYEKDQKFIPAAAIYEHIVALKSNNIEYSLKMLKIYNLINNDVKIQRSLQIVCEAIVFNKKAHIIDTIFEKEDLNTNYSILIYEHMVIYLLQKEITPEEQDSQAYLFKYIDIIINYYLDSGENKLKEFCSKLSVLNKDVYEYACNKLSNK